MQSIEFIPKSQKYLYTTNILIKPKDLGAYDEKQQKCLNRLHGHFLIYFFFTSNSHENIFRLSIYLSYFMRYSRDREQSNKRLTRLPGTSLTTPDPALMTASSQIVLNGSVAKTQAVIIARTKL